MKVYNEVRLGQSHRWDVAIGVICGSALAAGVIYDITQRIAGWLAG